MTAALASQVEELREERDRLADALREFFAFVVVELDPEPPSTVDAYLAWSRSERTKLRASLKSIPVGAVR